jgi:hypothetical protein
MNQVIWTPEQGWIDNGPEVTLTLDDKGRLTTNDFTTNLQGQTQPARHTGDLESENA